MERQCRADPLCRGLDIPVREMGITQSHPHVAVAEQPRDDRHRDAVHGGVTGHRAAKIVQAHILDSDLLADPLPEQEMGVMRAPGIARRRKHERALLTGLARNNAPRPSVEIHLPRSWYRQGRWCLRPPRSGAMERISPLRHPVSNSNRMMSAWRARRVSVRACWPSARCNRPSSPPDRKRVSAVRRFTVTSRAGFGGDVTAGDGEFENLAKYFQVGLRFRLTRPTVLAQRDSTWNVAPAVGWMSGYAFG